MRFITPLEQGTLVRRYKRFLADIVTDTGEALCIHCPNTGSMLNCMGEGARVWFQRNSDPKRKLPGTWELVETPQGRLACVNTARANRLVEEALLRRNRRIEWLHRAQARSSLRGGKQSSGFSAGLSHRPGLR